ncbi:MAG: hypothetical protein F6K03_04245, partial [Kamptonema sp. SIO4C4]|nr:hypothetical protein [Kamptonema sp. SIO4C4]
MNKLIRLGLIVAAWGVLSSCQGQTTDEQLEQAAAAMADMTKRPTLSRSCFYVVYPNGQ